MVSNEKIEKVKELAGGVDKEINVREKGDDRLEIYVRYDAISQENCEYLEESLNEFKGNLRLSKYPEEDMIEFDEILNSPVSNYGKSSFIIMF